MCFDPITIASMVATGVGQAISGSEAAASRNAQIEARNRATRDEFGRQAGYQQQADDIFGNVFGTFAPGAQASGLDAAKTGATDFIRGNQPLDVGTIQTAGVDPRLAAFEGNSVAKAFGRNANRAGALGNLTGYGQQGAESALNLAESGRKLNTVSNFSRGSASLLPLERDAAGNNAYIPPSGLGDLLGFAGTLGSYNAGKGTLPTFNIFGNRAAPANVGANGMFARM